MLQCSGGTVKINRPGYRPGLPCGWTSSTGQPVVPEAVFPGKRPHETLVFRAGISRSTWSPHCGHRNTGTGCTPAERSRSGARGFLSVESSTVWPSRFKSLFNPSLSRNLGFWDSIVSGPNWEAIHCFSYLKNPIPRLHTSEMGTCSWRLLNFFKI